MYELIYRSVAAKNISDTNIENILFTARKFNLENNITGCLLFHNNEFIQILEGDKKTVKELYSRIEKDTRHEFVRTLAENPKSKRLFNGWGMAYNKLSDTDINNIEKLLFIDNITTMADLTNTPTNAAKIFWYMAKRLVLE